MSTKKRKRALVPKKRPGPLPDAAMVGQVMDVATEAEALHWENLRRERVLLDKRDELVAMLPDERAQKALVVLNGHLKQQQGNNTTRMIVFARIRQNVGPTHKTPASQLGKAHSLASGELAETVKP